jgi:hypothetical protein
LDLTISVGDVAVKLRGVDYTPRQVSALLRSVASIAVALGASDASEPETERPPMGFGAHIERAPDVVEDLSEWFEESP